MIKNRHVQPLTSPHNEVHPTLCSTHYNSTLSRTHTSTHLPQTTYNPQPTMKLYYIGVRPPPHPSPLAN